MSKVNFVSLALCAVGALGCDKDVDVGRNDEEVATLDVLVPAGAGSPSGPLPVFALWTPNANDDLPPIISRIGEVRDGRAAMTITVPTELIANTEMFIGIGTIAVLSEEWLSRTPAAADFEGSNLETNLRGLAHNNVLLYRNPNASIPAEFAEPAERLLAGAPGGLSCTRGATGSGNRDRLEQVPCSDVEIIAGATYAPCLLDGEMTDDVCGFGPRRLNLW